jgi:hypothetical protein
MVLWSVIANLSIPRVLAAVIKSAIRLLLSCE